MHMSEQFISITEELHSLLDTVSQFSRVENSSIRTGPIGVYIDQKCLITVY